MHVLSQTPTSETMEHMPTALSLGTPTQSPEIEGERRRNSTPPHQVHHDSLLLKTSAPTEGCAAGFGDTDTDQVTKEQSTSSVTCCTAAGPLQDVQPHKAAFTESAAAPSETAGSGLHSFGWVTM